MNPPDWASIPTDILCPLCEYNLRGLVKPRCPECGHQFNWEQIAHQDNAQHLFLFEHGHTHRALRALRTVRESLLCRRFWGLVRPTVRISLRRLFVYWFVFTASPVVLWSVTDFALRVHGWNRKYTLLTTWRSQMGLQLPPTSRLSYVLACARGQNWSVHLLVLILILWPWLTLLAFRVFAITLRRNKIRWGHVVRVVVYSGDIAWMMLVPLTILAFSADLGRRLLHILGAMLWVDLKALIVIQCILFLVLIMGVRLCIASRRYLALPQAIATAILTQVLYVLLLLVVLVNLLAQTT